MDGNHDCFHEWKHRGNHGTAVGVFLGLRLGAKIPKSLSLDGSERHIYPKEHKSCFLYCYTEISNLRGVINSETFETPLLRVRVHIKVLVSAYLTYSHKVAASHTLCALTSPDHEELEEYQSSISVNVTHTRT
jgi:hypothetical protein